MELEIFNDRLWIAFGTLTQYSIYYLDGYISKVKITAKHFINHL